VEKRYSHDVLTVMGHILRAASCSLYFTRTSFSLLQYTLSRLGLQQMYCWNSPSIPVPVSDVRCPFLCSYYFLPMRVVLIECARSHIRILRTAFKGVPGHTCEDFLGS
jgi:hypothetical protein